MHGLVPGLGLSAWGVRLAGVIVRWVVFPHSERIYVETLCYWDFPVLPIDLQSLVAGVLAGIRAGETWAIMAITRACGMVHIEVQQPIHDC